MERVAKVDHLYRLTKIVVGERYDVDPADVRTLLTFGWIEPMEGEEGYSTTKTTYRTRSMKARA